MRKRREEAFRRGYRTGAIGVLYENEAAENERTPAGRAENDELAGRLYDRPRALPK